MSTPPRVGARTNPVRRSMQSLTDDGVKLPVIVVLPETRRRVEAEARARGITVAELVRRWIAEGLERKTSDHDVIQRHETEAERVKTWDEVLP